MTLTTAKDLETQKTSIAYATRLRERLYRDPQSGGSRVAGAVQISWKMSMAVPEPACLAFGRLSAIIETPRLTGLGVAGAVQIVPAPDRVAFGRLSAIIETPRLTGQGVGWV